jgi:pyruvate dehydrogenase E2 component (dihydrolipoamide acetyltransferase)
MVEATVVEWCKQDGEWVEKGELLFTFESDKATLELEAPVSGRLRILVPAGQTVPVNTPVAVLGEAISASATASAVQPESHTNTPPLAEALPRYETVRATPKARQQARQQGISLDGIRGSGPRGMIVSADLTQVEAANASPVARRMAAELGLDLRTIEGTGPRGQITRQDVERHLQQVAPPSKPAFTASSETTPLSGLRAIIAERLAQGWRERPQVTLTTEADATNLVSAREQALAGLGEKVSYDALLVMIVARALQEFPYMNVRLTERGVEALPQINIGVAVDTDRGLLVPVIRDAAHRPLREINRTLQALAERALAGCSLPDDLTDGTFTITNLGMYGIDAFTPIINPPECAILGVGRIVARPVGLDGQIVLRQMMVLSLSFDHRLVDGAPAARFLARIRQLIENPLILML